jgi:hypothetical protein
VIDCNTGTVATTFSVADVTTNAHKVNDYDSDNGNTGWDAVGKTALGSLDLSDDEQILYVMHVQNRRLVALNAVTGAQIAAVDVPTTSVSTPVIPGSGPLCGAGLSCGRFGRVNALGPPGAFLPLPTIQPALCILFLCQRIDLAES